MNQFGLPSEAVDAANKGGKYALFISSPDVPTHFLQNSYCNFHVDICFTDVEAFAKAMEGEAKTEQEGKPKDKKDDEEDMSLDQFHLDFCVFYLLLP